MELSFIFKMTGNSPALLFIQWFLSHLLRVAGLHSEVLAKMKSNSCLSSPINDLEEPSLCIGGQLRNQIHSHRVYFPIHYPEVHHNNVSGTEHLLQASNTT